MARSPAGIASVLVRPRASGGLTVERSGAPSLPPLLVVVAFHLFNPVAVGRRGLHLRGLRGPSFFSRAQDNRFIHYQSVNSYANAVLSSFEDPEKILDQAVLEMNDDLTKMRQGTAQVLIRIRPITDEENAAHGQKRCLMQDSSKSLNWTGHPETIFTFDHVACETISQEKLFGVVGLTMVENCMSGYNGCTADILSIKPVG